VADTDNPYFGLSGLLPHGDTPATLISVDELLPPDNPESRRDPRQDCSIRFFVSSGRRQ